MCIYNHCLPHLLNSPKRQGKPRHGAFVTPNLTVLTTFETVPRIWGLAAWVRMPAPLFPCRVTKVTSPLCLRFHTREVGVGILTVQGSAKVDAIRQGKPGHSEQSADGSSDMFESIPDLRYPAPRRRLIKAPMRTPKREQSDSWLPSKMPSSL